MWATLQHILEYKLIQVKGYTFTPFDILIVILIFLIAKVFIWLLSKFIRRTFLSDKIHESRQVAVTKLISYFVYTIATVVALENIGIDISFIIAGSAAFLVGLGFGVQQIFGDFVSGLIILFEGIVGINDIVELDDGTVGRVQEIGLRTSRITTRDNIDVIIPNSKFILDNVVNWSHNRSITRFDVKVGVAYGSDVNKVRKCLLKCAKEHTQAVDNPAPYVRFEDFGDSALEFVLFFWTQDDFRVERIKSDIRFAIDNTFSKNDITIPFPQRDLHIKSSQVDFQ